MVLSVISFNDQERICRQILGLDNQIRFVGIINEQGILVYYDYNRDITPLITNEELRLSAMQALIRMGTRQTFAHKTGDVYYSVTVYERVKRATIPLNAYYTLLVSLDAGANHESIIVDKILPAIEKPIGD
ncbi:MAG TPA: hypothetical protein VFA15_04780 [Nitrososphaera sp.]|nr:hypothetical protein [Nitrososphaera sp.]